MEVFLELMKLLVPSLALLLMAWLMLRAHLRSLTHAWQQLEQIIVGQFKQQTEQRRQDLRLKQQETLQPLRLQAYERMTLFCARIELAGLMLRTLDDSLTAKQYRFMLAASIEEEYNHNITQQVYMSDELWKMVQLAKAEALKILEQVAKTLAPEAQALDFLRAVQAYLEKEPQVGFIQAQVGIKKEVRALFEP